ncbi:MAG: hypothetical protein EHM62_06190 [Methylococcus sp.]|nr:MAG: hypothetical protein EHM62_06190 [Methylococcus sp.]
MSAIQARAALELRRRQASGANSVAVLVKSFDGNGWRWKGDIITDKQADAVRRTWRGQMVIVTRSPAALPATAADTENAASSSWN